MIDEPNWRFNVYMAGIGRVHDTQNFDFIKHQMVPKKLQEKMAAIMQLRQDEEEQPEECKIKEKDKKEHREVERQFQVFRKGMTDLYESFGILNLFCPYRPDGSYMLKMAVYEEKLVCKILCELAKSEGWQYLS